MNNEKIIAHVLYAVGIVGGVESVVNKDILIAVVALIVIIIASYMLDKS